MHIAQCPHLPLDVMRSQLPIGRWHIDQLGADEALDPAALVDVDVRRRRADDPLVGPDQRRQADDVRPRPTPAQQGGGIVAEEVTNLRLKTVRHRVGSVGDGGTVVDGGHGVEDRRGDPSGVVAGERVHGWWKHRGQR